jgi:hypothetical protein
VWDSAAFSSIFLASSFSCSQAESTPAHTQVTQTVGRWRSKFKIMRKLYILLSFFLISCSAVKPALVLQSPTFSFQSPVITKKDVAEKEGLDLTVRIFSINKNIVFLFGGMMAYDGEYQSLQSVLLRSQDGGNHWEEVMSPIGNSSAQNFSMLESGVGWVLLLDTSSPLSYKYILYQTRDNGLNWQELSVLPLSFTNGSYPIILQIIWVDEFHGQIDILYNGNDGYLEFLTTSDGGRNWTQAGIYKPEFEDGTPTWTILDSYRSRITETLIDAHEASSLVNDSFWKLDGKYGDPDTNVIVIERQIFMDNGSPNIQKIILPKHFDFIEGEIIAYKTK